LKKIKYLIYKKFNFSVRKSY